MFLHVLQYDILIVLKSNNIIVNQMKSNKLNTLIRSGITSKTLIAEITIQNGIYFDGIHQTQVESSNLKSQRLNLSFQSSYEFSV